MARRSGSSRAVIVGVVAVVALGAGYAAAPAPRLRLPVEGAAGAASAIRGAIHVHSDRSDGTGDVETIAAAAARAGLRFVVFTDHGDGRRSPATPHYQSGVLCIDGVEVSTDGGHVIALGLDRTPYTLGGDADGVVEDIARWGGVSIVAHPDSSKPDLRWTNLELPFDGLEWLNADSEWRDEGILSLARSLATYWFRGPESLARLLDRPPALAQWDVLTRSRSVVALAGSDAHARLGMDGRGELNASRVAIPLPSYVQLFQTLSITLDGVSLSGEAGVDARRVLDAIHQGRAFSTIDGVATPGQLAFSAATGSYTARMGESLDASGPVTLTVETNAVEPAEIRLIKDGLVVQTSPGLRASRVESAEPAVYRVEVVMPSVPGRPSVPWLVSNPIYVRRPSAKNPPAQRPAVEVTTIYANGPAKGWDVERSVRSSGALDVVPDTTGTLMAFRYALGGTASESPFAAIAIPITGAEAGTAVRFRVRASQPTRVSVQLRVPTAGGGQRWRAGSVYLDETARTVTVPFRTMRPTDGATSSSVPLADVRSMLIVVDHTHTPLGTSGRLWMDDVALVREASAERP